MSTPNHLQNPPVSAESPSSMGLTTRLVLAITVAAWFTLTIAVCYLGRAMHRGLIHEHEEMLEDHLSGMRRAVVKDSVTLHEAREILHISIGGDKSEKSYGRLVTTDGTVVEETPGFASSSPPISTFPPPLELNIAEVTIQNSTTSQGHPVFIAAARIARQGAGEPLVYYMTTDALPEQHFMRGFRWQLAGVVLGGTLLSAALGWIITRRGLRPLHEITHYIETTHASALQVGAPSQSGSSEDTRLWPRELSRLATAFASLRTRLSRSFQQLQQFSDDAAHEIRSPLNNILNTATLTLQRDRPPEAYRAALVSTIEECERLRELANGLLFISRADHRNCALAVTTFDARTAVEEVIDYHQNIADDRNVTLSHRAAGCLSADRTLFRQALTNLLSNALRHTPAGGVVSVDFTSGQDNGGSPATARLVVQDNGEGIAPELLPLVFDRFYRIDGARTHDPASPPRTGLGLAIVKTIVELHGGAISVTSEVGRGTTFTVDFPPVVAALDSPEQPHSVRFGSGVESSNQEANTG